MLRVEHSPKAGALPGVAIAATALSLALFGAIVVALSLQLRADLRAQLINRDAEILHPVALSHLEQARADAIVTGILLPESDLLSAALNASRLQGVAAVRIFDKDEALISAFPMSFFLGEMPERSRLALDTLEPFSIWHERVSLSRWLFSDEDRAETPAPILEVWLPLYEEPDRQPLGLAHYLIDGRSLREELRSLDHSIALQGALIFLGGGGMLSALLIVAFRRLQKANLALAERGRRLAQANHELAMTAKTSAIGSVAAHLMHGLKNPLSGLREFAEEGREREGGEPWDDALEAVERMQRMTQEIVELISEEEIGQSFDFTLEEIVDIVVEKAGASVKDDGVALSVGKVPGGTLDSRKGNVLILALTNLAQNALEACGEQGRVSVECHRLEKTLCFRVADNGPGLPDFVQASLFKPTRSGKPGGSGIGLSITASLARNLGGEARLVSSGPEGTVFEIELPEA